MAMTDEWQNRAAVNSDYLTQNLTPGYGPAEVIDPASVVDITHCLRPGANELRIEVANQLVNRMIGDLQLPEAERTTFATTPIVKPGDALLPAGITGGAWIVGN